MLVLELDHSQAHKQYREDAFIPSNFNLYPGDSVLIVRSIVADKNSIGPYNHAYAVQPGTIMHHTFTINDSPPKGKENMPKFDQYDSEKDHDIGVKELREMLKQCELSTKGSLKDIRKRCKNAKLPIPTKKKYKKKIIDYIGLPIGLMELLWRRGYIDLELPKNKLSNDKAAREIAKSIDQFKNELSELELTMKILGVEVSFTPKAHCEIAGRSIEYLNTIGKYTKMYSKSS